VEEVDCVVPENIHIPTSPKEGTFTLDPHPLGISIPRGACHTPLLPGISMIFHLDWEPPGENISVKNAVSLYHYVKCNCV